MNILIERLIQDHKNISRIHRCLRREMQCYIDGDERPNVGILLDAVDYLKNYPEFFHHPLEDKIYAKMRPKVTDEDIIKALDTIELQHAQLEVFSRRLFEDLATIANDQVLPVKRLLNDFHVYIDMAEEHLECENQSLFPAILRYLSEADFEEVKQELEATQDPVFGKNCSDVYEQLYKEVVRAEPEGAEA